MAAIAAVESFDNFAPLRNGLRRVAAARDDWAGIPMPLEGHRLIIHPKYPGAKELSDIVQPQAEPDDGKATLRNEFWSSRLRCHVLIWDEDGRVQWGRVPGFHHIQHDLRTLGASVVWGLEQEGAAVQLLGTMVRHHQLKQYLLTGMFMESSKRSGLSYLFRKLKPTVVIDNRGERPRIMCCLCMHAIAYYQDSWAGAMCPTDDVIAHLALMRGDEAMFWKRSSQHQPDRPEAGL